MRSPSTRTLPQALLLALLACRHAPPAPAAPPPGAALRLRTVPADARLTVGDLPGSEGRLEGRNVRPGRLAFRAERQGFAPLSGVLELAPGERLERTLELEPLPVALAIEADPPGAELVLERPGAAPRVERAPFAGSVPAGPLTVTLRAPGRNPLTLSRYLDAPAQLRLYLDPEGQRLHRLALFQTGREPKQVAISPDGREAWVAALDGPPSVLVHDLETGRVLATLALGEHGAVEVLFSRDGERVYASQMETGLVYELSVRERRLLRTLDARGKWSKVLALSPDGRRLYVSNWLGADVSELDLERGVLVRKLKTVATPRGLYPTADGRWLYVAGFERGELARVDLRSGESEVVFSSGGALRHLVADEARGRLYVSDMAKARIWVHDLRTGRTRELARTERNPNTIALGPGGGVLYVSCRGRNGPGGYLTAGKEPGSVLLLDAQSGERLETLVAGKQPTALAVSSDGARLVFSDFRDDRLEVYAVPQPLAGGPAEKSSPGPIGSRMEPGGPPWP